MTGSNHGSSQAQKREGEVALYLHCRRKAMSSWTWTQTHGKGNPWDGCSWHHNSGNSWGSDPPVSWPTGSGGNHWGAEEWARAEWAKQEAEEQAAICKHCGRNDDADKRHRHRGILLTDETQHPVRKRYSSSTPFEAASDDRATDYDHTHLAYSVSKALLKRRQGFPW